MSSTVQIQGMDELLQKLNQIGPKGEELMGEALMEGAQIVKKEAKRRVYQVLKRRSGNLQEAIKEGELRESKQGMSIVVGPAKGDTSAAYYGKFSEFGSSHEKAKPWLRPSLIEKEKEIEQTMQEIVGKGLEEFFAK